MPRKKTEQDVEILEKLEYIGLNLNKIPESLKKFEPLQFVFPKINNEKQQYKQYRFIPIKDIQILLSPTNRLDDLKEKYRKAMPLSEYLDNKSEENFLRHTTFLDMLRKVKIKDIEKIEEEQEKLSKQLPFKVKFEGNYLWQIYYSEVADKYFMLVPTKDSNYSTFFYLLKKKLEKSRTAKIFVPVMGVNYSKKFLSGAEIEDLENFLWVLTHDWPLIYEVYDKQDNASMQILGETAVFDNIKSQYKVVLNTQTEAKRFYRLLKAMFILQTELPNYFEFRTNITEEGGLEFFLEDEKIEYTKLAKFVKSQYAKGEKRKVKISERIVNDRNRLENLKREGSLLDIEFVEKEKQISTFLECKKTFFGKFKYYFKYSKKNKKSKIKNDQTEVQKKKVIKTSSEEIYKEKELKDKYTIEELVDSYKELENLDTELKNIIMDINAIKLKNKNMKKKIENATAYIQEIDSHKKSIFEFWKYSNKDEISSLPEGEEEEVNIEKKTKNESDYKEDIELLGKNLDKMQLKNLSKTERESIFIASTNLIDILNKVKSNEVMPKEIESSLRELKREQKNNEIEEDNDDENEIFIKNIKEELKKDSNGKNLRNKFEILEIGRGTKQIGYKLSLEETVKNIKNAMGKVKLQDDITVYKAIPDNKIDKNMINVFNIDPEDEIKEVLKQDNDEINFYKMELKPDSNVLGFTNCIFYKNKDKALLFGMDLSTKMIVDLANMENKLKKNQTFRVIVFEDEYDDFSKMKIKEVNLWE